jgi:alpha-amylase
MDVGYGLYDLYDLGEFDQKDTIRTKYGTRSEYLTAIDTAQQQGMQIYADVVLNHKNGGDQVEAMAATPVAWDDRNREIGPPQTLNAYTHFTFPGRGEQYSSLQWHWWHFDTVNHNADDSHDRRLYRLKNKHFDTGVDLRHGKQAFWMACDLDLAVPQVCEELANWGCWFLDTTGVNGLRLDAVKHIRAPYVRDWLAQMRHHTQRDLFAVGEYWHDDVNALHWFIAKTNGCLSLFDVPLHYNFHRASRQGSHYDLRKLLDNTLMQQQPTLAVTFVENHESQPLQWLESMVEPWFKPLAYAFILLRREGYPCIFYADYYGAHYLDKGRDGQIHEIWMTTHRWLLDKFLMARSHYAYGDQYDYLDDKNLIGWTRLGDPDHPQPLAVLMSNGVGGQKWMEVGQANTQFIDLTEHITVPVWTNEQGWGEFACKGESVSVWVTAPGPV